MGLNGHYTIVCAQVLASIVFLRLHPKPLRHTPSYEFTTSFGGVCWGIVAGVSRQWRMYSQNTPGRFLQIIQSRAGVMALIQRVAVGEHLGSLANTLLIQNMQCFLHVICPLARPALLGTLQVPSCFNHYGVV